LRTFGKMLRSIAPTDARAAAGVRDVPWLGGDYELFQPDDVGAVDVTEAFGHRNGMRRVD
jgi:hypothetical protein